MLANGDLLYFPIFHLYVPLGTTICIFGVNCSRFENKFCRAKISPLSLNVADTKSVNSHCACARVEGRWRELVVPNGGRGEEDEML